MAITRMGHIKDKGNGVAGIRRAIRYIVNPEKTEGRTLVGCYNLMPDEADIVGNATKQMVDTKRAYDKTGGRQVYHYKISFAKDDAVTPQLAMQIAREFCSSYLKDYEAVYAVHTDKAHMHFHVVFNSVAVATGLKYHYANGDWRRDLQPIVNGLCRKYGLSEIDVTARGKKENKSYNKWIADHPDQAKTSTKEYSYARIRADVDACINKAKTYADFLMLMKGLGYGVDDSKKHLKFYAPGREKAVRSYVLTPDKQTYTRENIWNMITGKFKEKQREQILARLYRDWNVFVGTERIDVILVRRKCNLIFAQHEEAVRMVMEQGFQNAEDAREYRKYLEQADRELNIIRKHVRSSMEYFHVYEDQIRLVMDYIESARGQDIAFGQVGQTLVENLSDEEERRQTAYEAYRELCEKGVSPIRLYRLYRRADEAMRRIEDFKKKLFVDKRICDRIIAAAKPTAVKDHVPEVNPDIQKEQIGKDVRNHE